MDEREWHESTDLPGLVRHVGTTPGFRKLWLFNAACCRRIAQWFPDDRARRLPHLVELRADGVITEPDWMNAFGTTVDPYLGNEHAHDGAGDLTFAAIMSLPYFDPEKTLRVAGAVVEVAGFRAFGGEMDRIQGAMREEVLALCDLFRCVVGNPFRPFECQPAWRTSTVLELARGIYDERAFDRMPILADALQDAGCDCDTALSHARKHPLHARGCWVIDAVLDKAWVTPPATAQTGRRSGA